jgi:GT2 family glycosyltransferase
MANLSICQKCGIRPASYGDGLTWSRCSKCQYEQDKESGVKYEEKPVEIGGFPHEVKEGLTSIIIPVYMVNYSLFHYTGHCIGSVREHTEGQQYEIVIVDNGSPIKPPSENSYYADKVITNEANLGVTKAWNQGIRMSSGEYIVLLNNDAQVYDGWLEGMLEHLKDNDLVMAHPMYSLTEPFARAVESKEVLYGIKQLDPLGVDFACVAFKRKLIDEVGPFDEQFFNYASDRDLLKRMEQKGLKYTMANNVAIHHIIDATGYSIAETPEIMNKDKEAFKQKWGDV